LFFCQTEKIEIVGSCFRQFLYFFKTIYIYISCGFNFIMDSKKRFEKIIADIKSVKIQGARNVAKAGLFAYNLISTKSAKNKILSVRPTEPMLLHSLNYFEKFGYKKTLEHFDDTQEKINKFVFKLIKSQDKIFTHCHSTNVVNALIYSKKKGKNFQVYNTETRPLFQGRKTAKQLKNAKIPVTMFVDSAVATALEKENRKDKIYSDKIFLGADAILKTGVINKIGSKMIAELAYKNKIPVFIVADSWKFSKTKVPIEQRSLNEVWDKAPKKIKIQNPAFEFIEKKYIKAIVSEFGILSFEKFLKRVN